MAKVLRRLKASFQGATANLVPPLSAKYKQCRCPIMMRDWTDGRTAKGLKIDPQVAKNADAPQTDVTRGRATDNLLVLRSITAEFVR